MVEISSTFNVGQALIAFNSTQKKKKKKKKQKQCVGLSVCWLASEIAVIVNIFQMQSRYSNMDRMENITGKLWYHFIMQRREKERIKELKSFRQKGGVLVFYERENY